MSVDIGARKWNSGDEQIGRRRHLKRVRRLISTLVRFCSKEPAGATYAARMSWVRAGSLLICAALAYGGSRQKAPGTPATANLSEIASAREAVREATASLGEDHPVTAFMLRNLALAMQQGGYPNYATYYAQKSLAILERHFGAKDVSLTPVLNVLTEAAVSQRQYDEARAYAMRAVDIGPDAEAHYGTALHNLAAIDQAEGKSVEAAGLYRRALDVREKFLPAGHPYIKMTRAALDQAQRSARLMARR